MNYSHDEIAMATRDVVWQVEHDVSGIGRVWPKTTSRVVRLAIELWPPIVPLPYPIAGQDAHKAATRTIAARVREQYEARYGMGIIATIILSAIIQQVVAALIRRWWGDRDSFRKRVRMAQVGLRDEH
jgi:hypothetical protein